MTVTHVRLFALPVSDPDRARDFYTGVLGFDLIQEMPMGPDRRWIQVAPPGAQTSITLVTWFESLPPGSVSGIVLETDDLDGEAAALRVRRVAISDIEDQPWGRFFTLTDPDGNGLILQASTR